jgi:hypothetical protein
MAHDDLQPGCVLVWDHLAPNRRYILLTLEEELRGGTGFYRATVLRVDQRAVVDWRPSAHGLNKRNRNFCVLEPTDEEVALFAQVMLTPERFVNRSR